MSTDANRREYALIEAAEAGDLVAAHALLDHLREQDATALADELAPLLTTEDGARKLAVRLTVAQAQHLAGKRLRFRIALDATATELEGRSHERTRSAVRSTCRRPIPRPFP
jgi:hypothetical protein